MEFLTGLVIGLGIGAFIVGLFWVSDHNHR